MNLNTICTESRRLQNFQVEIEGDCVELPTYMVYKQEIPELLAMENDSIIQNGNALIQRWNYRWFLCIDEDWISLRLVN